LFTYNVRTAFGFDLAAIHGPADSGTNAPKIVDLQLRRCDPPLIPVTIGGCFYSGSFSLPEEQTDQLLNEQWYVYSTSAQPTPFFLRGQITVVPEPGLLSFLLTMICVLFVSRWFISRPAYSRQSF
jgi:hypothetical protein